MHEGFHAFTDGAGLKAVIALRDMARKAVDADGTMITDTVASIPKLRLELCVSM